MTSPSTEDTEDVWNLHSVQTEFLQLDRAAEEAGELLDQLDQSPSSSDFGDDSDEHPVLSSVSSSSSSNPATVMPNLSQYAAVALLSSPPSSQFKSKSRHDSSDKEKEAAGPAPIFLSVSRGEGLAHQVPFVDTSAVLLEDQYCLQRDHSLPETSRERIFRDFELEIQDDTKLLDRFRQIQGSNQERVPFGLCS